MKTVRMIAALLLTCAASLTQAGFTLPKYEQYTLDNGLTVYLMPQQEVPLVHVRLELDAGAITDGNEHGIALMTAESLLLGSKQFSKTELDAAVDFRGATLRSEATLESATVIAEFLNKDTGAILPIFVDAVRQPQFPEVEVNKLRDRRLQQLDLARQSPRQVIDNYFRGMMYKGSVYANPVSGLLRTVKSIDRQAISQFYQRHYRPDGAALIVVGAFDSKAMKKQIKQAFGNWKAPAANDAIQAAAVPVAVNTARVLLVDKPDAIETTFYIGGAGVARNHPDYNALTVINTILGGRFTSWLNDELRVNSGLTYGARSQLNAMRGGGVFSITTFTAKANTEKAIDLALSTYQRLWNQGIDEATLSSAKSYVKGLYPPRFETAEDLADALATLHQYGMSQADFDRYLDDVEALTVADANRLARTHLPADKLQFVLIGNAAEISSLAAKYGEVSRVALSDDSFGAP